MLIESEKKNIELFMGGIFVLQELGSISAMVLINQSVMECEFIFVLTS